MQQMPYLSLNNLPSTWIDGLSSQLAHEENILAWLEIDLDRQLHFATGLIIVTDQRLLAKTADDENWQTWSYQPGLLLTQRDHAGVGCLELCDQHARLGFWRYRLDHAMAVNRLIECFTQQLEYRLSGNLPESSPASIQCTNCGAFLPPEQDECPFCEKQSHTPPSTWTLLRLWRFAKPYKGRLLIGFLLTLCSTAATLVPPYLTMPLMDNVLIPYQNGQPINTDLATFYLSGLLGAAVLAWMLGWARTYMLALVSERIGADLRTTTYEHLLNLSQEYFGGKRTGDLMARIGAETDRINLFISLHLLDFATDVIMICMTAIILVSINPWLALVTLIPLPIIAWLIHLVRDRLRIGFEKVDRIWAEVNNVQIGRAHV